MLNDGAPQPLGVRATRFVVMGKGLVGGAVGAAQFFGAPVLERGAWGSIRAFPPQWFGMVLLAWGILDFVIWQDMVPSAVRRAWWYCVASSACAVPVFVAASAMPYPGLLHWVSAAGVVSGVFLLVFRRAFEVQAGFRRPRVKHKPGTRATAAPNQKAAIRSRKVDGDRSAD